MDVFKAIYTRRAIRNYTELPVSQEVLLPLLHAAVQAPSGLNQQPWAFAIYQGRQKLHEFNDRAKEVFLAEVTGDEEDTLGLRATLRDPHFNIFHNATTLVVILAKPVGLNPADDCYLAAQNFMLAAHAQGLGTCPIGFARPWLRLPETKKQLGLPDDHAIVLAIVVGYPDEVPEAPPRNDPEILAWEVSRLDHLHSAPAILG